jgi:hypothetical protein
MQQNNGLVKTAHAYRAKFRQQPSLIDFDDSNSDKARLKACMLCMVRVNLSDR